MDGPSQSVKTEVTAAAVVAANVLLAHTNTMGMKSPYSSLMVLDCKQQRGQALRDIYETSQLTYLQPRQTEE